MFIVDFNNEQDIKIMRITSEPKEFLERRSQIYIWCYYDKNKRKNKFVKTLINEGGIYKRKFYVQEKNYYMIDSIINNYKKQRKFKLEKQLERLSPN